MYNTSSCFQSETGPKVILATSKREVSTYSLHNISGSIRENRSSFVLFPEPVQGKVATISSETRHNRSLETLRTLYYVSWRMCYRHNHMVVMWGVMPTSTHPHAHTHSPTPHKCTHTHTHTFRHTRSHKLLHTCTHTLTHAQYKGFYIMHFCVIWDPALVHTLICTYTHSCTCIITSMYMHMHDWVRVR